MLKTQQQRKQPNFKIGKGLEQTFLQRIYKWPTNIWKDDQCHQSLGKCKWKSQWDTTSHMIGWQQWKKQQWKMLSADKKLDLSCIADGTVKWCSCHGK